MTPPLYSTEAAAYLGVCVDTLMSLLHKGEVRGFRVGWRWKFDVCDLDAFKERGKTEFERTAAAIRTPRGRERRHMTEEEVKIALKEIMRKHRETHYAAQPTGTDPQKSGCRPAAPVTASKTKGRPAQTHR
ncbi:MAG: helix-turn-helix domain-containing protein [Oscillospiraceae bacterium]|jgi:excisionase family DNA binding protein|nr:helix-turn-helix domain-containing protein [Oscillospiraceae bacterium]